MSAQIEVITTASRLSELGEAWQRLWQRSKGDVFQAHSWIMAAIGGPVSPCRLRVAVAWQYDELVAALPLQIHRKHFIRTLGWIGQELSDYCDGLTSPAASAVVLSDLWSAVRQLGGFDLIQLSQVRPDARVRRILNAPPGAAGGLAMRDKVTPCLGVRNDGGDGETWFRTLNKKGRNNFTRGRRILEELGGEVALTIMQPPHQPITATLDQILQLKRKWLLATKPDSPFLGEAGNRLRSTLLAAADTGLLHLFLLTSGEEISAASVNFVYPDRLQAYLTAYDPRFERASPGTILIIEYTKWAFDRGLAYVDFLRGDEPFKFRLGNTSVRLNEYAGAQTLLGRVALQQHGRLSRVISRVRQMREGDPQDIQVQAGAVVREL